MATMTALRLLLQFLALVPTTLGFTVVTLLPTPVRVHSQSALRADASPSDYDTDDLAPEKTVLVSTSDEDEEIREALKRELILLSSVTNRGEYASAEERDIAIDLVTQLEALNPTYFPASNCKGDWDLCLSSTQFFRSSPFFQSIRVALGDDNKAVAENGFDIHDRATTGSRVGRVRQTITDTELISEVDLQVGPLTGLPIRVKGTVVTKASLDVISSESWELRIKNTQVKGSNIPIFNQFMDDLQFELPMADLYNTVTGAVPVIPFKTYYVDSSIRITRDVDDNFFVFSRA